MSAQPIPQLTVNANIGLLDQEFDEFGLGSDGQPLDPADANFFDSPDTTLSLRAQYVVPLAERGKIAIAADWSYRSRVFFDNDDLPFSSQDGYDLFNARVTWALPDGKWSLSFWGDNLFQETYVRRTLNVFRTPLGFATSIYGDPRTYGVTLTLRN